MISNINPKFILYLLYTLILVEKEDRCSYCSHYDFGNNIRACRRCLTKAGCEPSNHIIGPPCKCKAKCVKGRNICAMHK